jgi:hypothetical protein
LPDSDRRHDRAQQAVVEVLAADVRGEARDTVRLRDAAPSGGLILSVRRDPCGLRELLQFTKADEELFVRESKYSFTLRRATDSASKQTSSAKRPRVRTAADMGQSDREPTTARRSVYDDLASGAHPCPLSEVCPAAALLADIAAACNGMRPVSEEDPAQLMYEPRASGRSPAKRASAKKKARRVGPKRAMTAYFCFAAEARSRIAAEHPQLSMTEQAKEMGAQWKRMGDVEKQKYVDMAQKDQVRYASEKAEYFKDYPQPSPKRKNTRWSTEEMALLRSVRIFLLA